MIQNRPGQLRQWGYVYAGSRVHEEEVQLARATGDRTAEECL